jgi:hypothetical protein
MDSDDESDKGNMTDGDSVYTTDTDNDFTDDDFDDLNLTEYIIYAIEDVGETEDGVTLYHISFKNTLPEKDVWMTERLVRHRLTKELELTETNVTTAQRWGDLIQAWEWRLQYE